MKIILFKLLAKCGLILMKTFKEELKIGFHKSTELKKRLTKIEELEKQNKKFDAQVTFYHERFKGLLRGIIVQGLKNGTIEDLGRAGFHLVNFTAWIRLDDYIFLDEIVQEADFIKLKEDLRLQKIEQSLESIKKALTNPTDLQPVTATKDKEKQP